MLHVLSSYRSYTEMVLWELLDGLQTQSTVVMCGKVYTLPLKIMHAVNAVIHNNSMHMLSIVTSIYNELNQNPMKVS